MIDHLNQLVAQPLTSTNLVPLTPSAAAVTSLVAYDLARHHLSNLAPTIDGLSFDQKVSSISQRPSRYFGPHITTLLQ